MAIPEISSIGAKERDANPNIIFQLETESPTELALCIASYVAMKELKQPIVFDFDSGKKLFKQKEPMVITIRTNLSGKKQITQLGTVFQGLQEATRYRVKEPQDYGSADNYYDTAFGIAAALLEDYYHDPQMVEAFSEYYSGLRWSTDQEKYIRTMFEYGTPYDEQQIKDNLSSSLLTHVAYALDLPYGRRSNWYEQTPENILRQNPEIDYRKLKNPEFAQSKLKLAYAKALGQEMGQEYFRGRREITPDGHEKIRPVIPLSAFPIAEALVCFEISIDKPRAKYDFGPTDVFDLIAHSDSELAHQSLVMNLTTRLAPDQQPGMMFDGQNEFNHKDQGVRSIIRAYQEYPNHEKIHSLLLQDLQAIADEYIQESSSLVQSIYQDKSKYTCERDGRAIRSISRDLLITFLASPDHQLTSRAIDIIDRSMRPQKTIIVKDNQTVLTKTDLIIAVFDSLEFITNQSNPTILRTIASEIFGDRNIGRLFEKFASYRKQADEYGKRPEVLQALAKLSDFGFDEKEKQKQKQARAAYDQKMSPATELYIRLRSEKNELITKLLADSASNGNKSVAGGAFDDLVKRVEMYDYEMTELPKIYSTLLDISRNPNLPARQRNTIIWHIVESWKHLHEESQHILVPVIMDIYNLVLGPIDNVRMPDNETSIGIAAATTLVRENRGIFKAAAPEQLQLLADYGMEIQRLAKMVASNEFLTGENSNVSIIIPTGQEQIGESDDPQSWNKEKLFEIKCVARELNAIAESYNEYLHIEAVKVQPNVYYPWLLNQLVPFWRKMQWEVGEGNRPNGDITRLFKTLEEYIEQRLVIQDKYPDNFDVIREGHLGSFLEEMYRQMIVPHDIKYNGTVWDEGLKFMHYAVAYMPKVIVEQIKKIYPNTNFAIFLENEWFHWNKD
jgi:hypothetical protein